MNSQQLDPTKNTLALGDNIDLIKMLPDESIDLIYMDPPFNSNRNYIVVDQSDVKYFKDVWRGGDNTYLEFLFDRLVLLKQKMKKTASIYVHVDPTESHYVKMVMDRVFGRQNFRNEIVWCYSGPSSPGMKQFARKHDIILLYTKSDERTFNVEEVRLPYSESSMSAFGSASKLGGERSKYKDSGGRFPEDWWVHIPSLKNTKERVGYPTQKPLALLERIIKASSNEGDTVLDPFMGSGTTLVAAAKLGRKYIGFDQSASALTVARERLDQLTGTIFEPYTIYKDCFDYEEIRNQPPFEFEKFVVEKLGGIANDKQVHDMGIDGRIYGEEKIAISVKRSEHIGRNVVDNFVAAMHREGIVKGIIVAFSFNKGAEQEAARLRQESNYQIELKLVKDLVKINMPPVLKLTKTETEIVAEATDVDGEIINYTWWVNAKKYPPLKLVDKKGRLLLSELGNDAVKVICRASDDRGCNVVKEIEL